jgi:hypothetical protein
MSDKATGLAILLSCGLAIGASAQEVDVVTAADTEKAAQHLALFDRLDFEAWNNRDWGLFSQLHGENVKVAGFGTKTEGLDAHLNWGKGFITQVPEAKVVSHPIRIGAGDWTAVTGLLQDGSTMATIARWENGQVVEEYLFQLVSGQ